MPMTLRVGVGVRDTQRALALHTRVLSIIKATLFVPRNSPLVILGVRTLCGCPRPCEVRSLSLQACAVFFSTGIPSSRASRPIHADHAKRPTCSVEWWAIALAVVHGGVSEVGLSIKGDVRQRSACLPSLPFQITALQSFSTLLYSPWSPCSYISKSRWAAWTVVDFTMAATRPRVTINQHTARPTPSACFRRLLI